MKKGKFLPALPVLLILLFSASAAMAAEEMTREATTIDELVAMYDDSPCAGCHQEIYDEWRNSWHAKSIVSSLGGMRNFIAVGLAKEWSKPVTKAQILKCIDCHAPAVNFASEKLAKEIAGMIVTASDKAGTPAGDEAKAQLAKLNVGCLSCHNLKATSVARGLRGDPVKDAVYGPYGYDSEGHTTYQSVTLTRSAFCMQCHGIYYAPDGEMIQCNTLSGSYQNTYYNLGGSETCQDCHMEKGHLFPGGHDLDTVKKGLGLDVQVTSYQHLPGQVDGVKNEKAWVPSAVINVFVENKAGHRIPDG